MKNIFVVMLLFVSLLIIGCSKEEVAVIKKEAVIEDLPSYEIVENMESEEFDMLFSYIEDNVLVFDIGEVHNVIFDDLKETIDINSKSLDRDLEMIIIPFVNAWKTNKIRDLLIAKDVDFSESDVERYDELININIIIDFIVVYEKNALKMSK